MRPFLAVLPMLGLALGARAASFVHPVAQYRARVPSAWKSKLDAGVLVCAGAGGFRVRVEVEVKLSDAGPPEAERAYLEDGRRLKKAFGAVGVVQRPEPTEDWKLGQRPTYRYALKYRPRGEGIHQARGFFASGSGQKRAQRVWIKVLAYGDASAFQANTQVLAEFVASFRWPEPEEPEVAGTDWAPPDSVVQVPTEIAVAPRSPGDGGGSDEEPYRSKNDAFDRGAAQGSAGIMRFLKKSTNAERDRRLLDAWSPETGPRTDAQQDQAAQRMGFNAR